jgi:hypothetical protein
MRFGKTFSSYTKQHTLSWTPGLRSKDHPSEARDICFMHHGSFRARFVSCSVMARALAHRAALSIASKWPISSSKRKYGWDARSWCASSSRDSAKRSACFDVGLACRC